MCLKELVPGLFHVIAALVSSLPSHTKQDKFWPRLQTLSPSTVAASIATISFFANPNHGIDQAGRFSKMSSSLFALDQGQEVTLAPGAGLPHSPGHVSALLPSNDGLQGGSREALTIREPVPIPSIYSLKYEEILQYFAEKIANEGLDAATHLAAQYHKTKNPADAPTYGELKKRMEDAMANLGEKWDLFDQDRPSAMASRLLAPRAGQRYEFDEFERLVQPSQHLHTTLTILTARPIARGPTPRAGSLRAGSVRARAANTEAKIGSDTWTNSTSRIPFSRCTAPMAAARSITEAVTPRWRTTSSNTKILCPLLSPHKLGGAWNAFGRRLDARANCLLFGMAMGSTFF